MGFSRDVVIIGGCGRAGLPLGLALADAGLSVALYDRDEAAVERVRSAVMPFREIGAPEALARVIADGTLVATVDPSIVRSGEHVVIVVATDVDEHLNPDLEAVPRAVRGILEHLVDGQHVVLRSTVYPGVTAFVEAVLGESGREIDVSFCPERIAEGHALIELRTLPQIVSGRTETALTRAEELFGKLTGSLIRLTVEEAELAKLFTNSWRYLRFAAANQLYMIANDFGVDFERIRAAVVKDYPRAADMPSPGLAAGPCLLKDTMQLAAFNNNNFTLGHASMTINEGLPLYMVARLEQRYQLAGMVVGILGMAYKAESDDTRSSLSYKLKRLLRFKGAEVLCTDPYVHDDPELTPLSELLARSDLLIVGAPHALYAGLDTNVPVVDLWNLLGRGVRI